MVLLDTVPDDKLIQELRKRLETGDDRITDLHLWRIGPGRTAVIIAVIASAAAACLYKARLEDIPGLSHVTVEEHHSH